MRPACRSGRHSRHPLPRCHLALPQRRGATRAQVVENFLVREDEKKLFADRHGLLALVAIERRGAEAFELLHVSGIWLLCEIAGLFAVFHDVCEDRLKDDNRRLGGIHIDDQFRPVIVEQGQGFLFVGIEPPADHFLIRVVEPVVFQGPLLQARDDFVPVRAIEVENPLHIDDVRHEFGLPDVAGDSIEDEVVDIRLEDVSLDRVSDADLPELYRDLVRDEAAVARVFQEGLADRVPCIHAPENIAACAVEKPGEGADGGSLRALSTSGGTKEEIGGVFC